MIGGVFYVLYERGAVFENVIFWVCAEDYTLAASKTKRANAMGTFLIKHYSYFAAS
jgi:hypothetical protein